MFNLVWRIATGTLFYLLLLPAFAQSVSNDVEPAYAAEARALTPVTLKKIKAASEANDLNAKIVLGFAYLEGDAGLSIDDRRAVDLFESAAAGGQAFAQLMMAAIYLEGKHAEGGATKALPWLRKAAEQGHPEAFNLLAWIYLYGKPGVEADPIEACKWLTIGKTTTRDEGKLRAFDASMALVKKSLTPDQIETCNSLAKTWNDERVKK